MAITVKLFAALADWSGTRDLLMEHRPGLTCADVWNEVIRRYPKTVVVHPLFAINNEYVTPETSLKDGESVLLFPPVSGG